jgi:hypothetical protein
MSGPVTYGEIPFASTVTVGDSNSAPGNSGSLIVRTGPNPKISAAALAAAQVGMDDVDDGTPGGAARAKAYREAQVAAGIYKQEDLDKGDNAVAKEVDSRPPPTITGTQVDCTAIHESFNLNTMITPNVRLKEFIYDFPQIPNHKYTAVCPQMGLRPDEIVCNLGNLCYNIWEPLRTRYPNAIITNNLRTGASIGAGPHGTGQGMDIQFTRSGGGSINPSEYFALAQWMKDNISYDQLILEYASTGGGGLKAWIHCSVYFGTGLKVLPVNRVLTMMNHRVASVGLANLAN